MPKPIKKRGSIFMHNTVLRISTRFTFMHTASYYNMVDGTKTNPL